MELEMFELGKWFYRVMEQATLEINLTEPGLLGIKIGDVTKDLDLNLSMDPTFDSPRILKEEIIEAYKYKNVDADNICVTNGAQEANFISTMLLVEPRDEVVMLIPTWEQVYKVAEGLEANVKECRLNEKRGWKPDLEELKEVVSPKTKLIYICYPNNPTGAVLNAGEMRGICEIAEDCGAYILSDETYSGVVWDGPPSPSAVDYYEKAIATCTLSKTMGLTGLRVGWVISQDKRLIEKCKTFRVYTTLQNNNFGEYLATIALRRDKRQELLSIARRRAKANLELLSRWISEQEAFSWTPPRATFCCFPRYDFEIPSSEFCERLLLKERIFVAPGICFKFDKHLRIGFGIETDKFRQGLERLSRFVEIMKK